MAIPMSPQQQGELERAIARAHREGVQIVARGTRKADGARVFGVTSTSSAPAVLRMVVVLPGRLECDCPARVICTHRGIVREALQQELAARSRQMFTAKAAEIRAEEALRQRREPSPLARDD